MVAHLAQIRLAEQRVAVSAQFAVEADQVALLGDHQRVDLDQREVALKEDGRQAHKDFGELLNLLTFQAQFKCQLASLVRHWAGQRIESHFVDQVRGLFRYFFNFHAAFGRGHEHYATRAAVNNRAQIELFIDIGRSFYQDLVNRLAVGIRLVGHQTLAQPVLSKRTDLFFAVNDFNAARFTAATGVYLALDYPRAAADF